MLSVRVLAGLNILFFPPVLRDCNQRQAANLRGFRASVNPRFEAGIPDFMNGILNFSIHFNVVHRKVDWRNPKMKSLNSMPERPWYVQPCLCDWAYKRSRAI